MTEKTYTLTDFGKEVDIAHPLTARRIPVLRHCYPSFKYHVAIVIGSTEWSAEGDVGIEPEPFEVEQLCAYLEKHMRYYNATYRAKVAARAPFDVDGTVNTHTFRKHAEHRWQYHVSSWTSGPTWFPTPPWQKAGPFSLEALLDRINSFGEGPPMQSWLNLKSESGAFDSVVSS